MSQYYNYNSYQPVEYTHEQSYLNSDAVASGMVCEPSSSDAQQFYPYFDEGTPRQRADAQDSWVSPIYYDLASGLYIQKFPPEYDEFLEKYGQRIEVPEHPEPQHSGWTSADSFEVAMSSPANDYEAASMLQYITSPPVAAAQPGEQGVPSTSLVNPPTPPPTPAAPSLLADLHIPAIDEAPSPTASFESERRSTSGTHQSHSPARSLSPKGKKRAISRLKPTFQKRPTLRLSPEPASKKSASKKKQTLACLFCRGRKIACGPPLLGSPDQTCNQCARRCLKCEYPTESKHHRKKKVPKVVSQRAP